MGYSGYDFEYRKEVSKGLGDMNVGIVRDYVFINSANLFTESHLPKTIDSRVNRLYIMDNVLYNLQQYAPNSQVLGVLHDMKWEIDQDIPLSQFYDLIRKAVKRYNGKTLFLPTDAKKEISYEIKYWEICNEFDINIYGYKPFEIAEKAFELLKNSYRAIKAANPDAVVVFPGISNPNCKFVKDILEFQDFDGKRIWDYFDVFNFHVYPQSTEDLIYYINIIKDYQKKYGWNKPIWLTEVGWSELLMGEKEVSILLPKMYLISMACGIEKVFQFQFRRFDSSMGEDPFFGLVKSSLDGTYISLLSDGNPLSLGSAYSHILVRNPKLVFSPSNYRHKEVGNCMYQKLKRSGLTIRGNDYVINKISILHEGQDSVIFDKEKSGEIFIPPSAFVNMNYSDTIIIFFKCYKKKLKWKRTDKTLSYFSVKNLIKLIPDGSSMPTLKKGNGIYEVKWQVGKKLVTALWSEKGQNIALYGKKKYNVLNYLGKKVKINPVSVKIDNTVLFFDGDVNYTIQ